MEPKVQCQTCWKWVAASDGTWFRVPLCGEFFECTKCAEDDKIKKAMGK
jgi:hypothetical protein